MKRPPFRFIHDVFTATKKQTGFGDDYFTDQELDSANINEKEQKLAFLDKLIN